MARVRRTKGSALGRQETSLEVFDRTQGGTGEAVSTSEEGDSAGGDDAVEVEIVTPDAVLPPEDLDDDENLEGDSSGVFPIEEDGEQADGIVEAAARYEDEGAAKSLSRAIVPYNALDAYLAEIRRLPPLTKEAEHEAALQYHRTKSPEAAYTLVSGNLWLVVKIARDYERVARNILDIIQEGNIGLMEAVRNFDPYRGVRFPSYAVWWIRAYIIRYIIANWRLVKIGTTQAQRKLFFNLKKESERLEREGIFPEPKLLAEKLHVRESDVVEMSQRLAGSDLSVDAPLQDDGESTLHSVLAAGGESVEEVVARRQLHTALQSSLREFEGTLNSKERLIFTGRVIGEDKRTLQELSDELSLSKERVRQIESKLREKLRSFVSLKMGGELEHWVDAVEE